MTRFLARKLILLIVSLKDSEIHSEYDKVEKFGFFINSRLISKEAHYGGDLSCDLVTYKCTYR